VFRTLCCCVLVHFRRLPTAGMPPSRVVTEPCFSRQRGPGPRM
jgi:hypothetical protein